MFASWGPGDPPDISRSGEGEQGHFRLARAAMCAYQPRPQGPVKSSTASEALARNRHSHPALMHLSEARLGTANASSSRSRSESPAVAGCHHGQRDGTTSKPDPIWRRLRVHGCICSPRLVPVDRSICIWMDRFLRRSTLCARYIISSPDLCRLTSRKI